MDNQIIWPGWETVRVIGRGSYGTVYEIQKELLGEYEKAALKVISIPQHESDIASMYNNGYDRESITDTFQAHLKNIVSEYSMMRKMKDCPNIVGCDEVRYIQHDDGFGWDIFIKMELLTPLPETVPSEISERTVINLASAMCNALEMCSRYNIIHRDIKPENIFVSENGVFKLGDFGIAKTVEKTMSGTMVGTYRYMAPEVCHSQPYGNRADIYSLGLVLYWMLNERRLPFLPLSPAKITMLSADQAKERRLAGEPLPAPKNGSDALKAIVLKACAYKQEYRYQSAAEMLDALHALGTCIASTPALVSPPSSADPVDELDGTVGPFCKKTEFQTDVTVGPDWKAINQTRDQTAAGNCDETDDPSDSTIDKEDGSVTVGPVFAESHNKKISTNTSSSSLVQSAHTINSTPAETTKADMATGIALPNGGWRCLCKRSNAAYVSTCACGTNKRELKLVPETSNQASRRQPDRNPVYPSPLASNGSWLCSCGRTNAAYVSTCVCGTNKREVLKNGEPQNR